jgi:hypothetical protein
VILPREISSAAAARRSLLADLLAAIALALLALQLAAGVGVVGLVALIVFIVLAASITVEAVIHRRRP